MRRFFLIPLLAVAATACDDGPGRLVGIVPVTRTEPLRLSLTAPVLLEGVIVEDVNGGYYLRCLVDVSASASGGSTDDAILWHSAAVDYYSLATGALITGYDLGLQDMIEIWGERSLGGGSARMIRLVTSEYVPFRVILVFRYTTAQDPTVRVASVSTDCIL